MSAAAAASIADYRPRPELLKTRAYEPQRYTKFRARHDRRPFAPDFNTRLQAVVLDREAYDIERVDCWVRLMSHGNFNDLATDASDQPLGAADCGRALGLPKQRVSEAMAELEKRHRLRRRGRQLYPVDDPIAEAQKAKMDDLGQNCPDSPDIERIKGEHWRQFREIFAQEHPDLIEQRDAARKILEAVAAAERDQFKQWRKSQTPRTIDATSHRLPGRIVTDSPDESSQTPRTNSGPILIEEVKKDLEGGKASSSSTSSSTPHTTTTTPLPSIAPRNPENPAVDSQNASEAGRTSEANPEENPENPSVDSQTVSEAIARYTEPEPANVATLIAACRRGTPDATAQEIASAIHSREDWIRHAHARWPYLLKAVPGLFTGGAWRAKQPDTSPAPSPPLTADERRKAKARQEFEERLLEELRDAGREIHD